MAAPEVHAKLGASSSHAWLHCPQYLRMQELFPETTSQYAEAGRLAHAIAEYKARTYFLEPAGKRAYNAQLKRFREDPCYSSDMDEATELYLDTLKALALAFSSPAFVALETRVDYSGVVPGGFGTADCVMLGAGRMVVVDYKNGAGVPVEAERNSQLMLYALGVLQTYRPIYGDTLTAARLVIVQPRAGGVKEWDISVDDLRQWGRETAAPAARLALDGTAPACPGEWCRFCRGKAQCSARAAQLLELGKQYQLAPPATPHAVAARLLTDEEVGQALTAGAELVSWYNELRDYALLACLDGKIIPGFKAVEGRGSREWGDLDAAFAALEAQGVDRAMLWERKPVTVPALERALGKKVFAEVSQGLVVKRPGKPTLVSDSDGRPSYQGAAAAFEVVPGE